MVFLFKPKTIFFFIKYNAIGIRLHKRFWVGGKKKLGVLNENEHASVMVSLIMIVKKEHIFSYAFLISVNKNENEKKKRKEPGHLYSKDICVNS